MGQCVLYYLARAEAGLGEIEPAERHLREAIEILETVAREGFSDHYLLMYAQSQVHLARLLNERGRYGEAGTYARGGSEILAFALPHEWGKYVEGQLELARSVSGQGKTGEAEILFTCLLRPMKPESPPEMIAKILIRYAEHLRRNHRDADAEQMDERARKLSHGNRDVAE